MKYDSVPARSVKGLRAATQGWLEQDWAKFKPVETVEQAVGNGGVVASRVKRLEP